MSPHASEHSALLQIAAELQGVLAAQPQVARRECEPHLANIARERAKMCAQLEGAEEEVDALHQAIAAERAASVGTMLGKDDASLFADLAAVHAIAEREHEDAQHVIRWHHRHWPADLRSAVATHMRRVSRRVEASITFPDLLAVMAEAYVGGKATRCREAHEALVAARSAHVAETRAPLLARLRAAQAHLLQLRSSIDACDLDTVAMQASVVALDEAAGGIRAMLCPADAPAWSACMEGLALLALLSGKLLEFHMRMAVANRSITRLVHFTHRANVESIRNHGILPVPELKRRGITPRANDHERLDHLRDAVSMSIEFPNWQLFFKFRREQYTRDEDWCVLTVCPSVLWTNACVFSAENAAAAGEAKRPLHVRQGLEAFHRLFEDAGSSRQGITRSQLGALPTSYPTNPQAEVQVLGGIAPEKILAVRGVSSEPALFKPRHDYSMRTLGSGREAASLLHEPLLEADFAATRLSLSPPPE
ncbi:MAG: DarT ssDNA thymidine ADP-ribosyltransferase family protein [Phycisphaerales bacterium]